MHKEEKIDKILKKADERLKGKLEKINLERIIEDSNCAKELKKVFNKIEDNNNIKNYRI